MKKNLFLIQALLLSGMLSTLACNPNGPTGPTGGTPTPTQTLQATPAGTPPCVGAPDITANIDGADYLGNDAGKSLPGFFNLDQDGTAVGDVLTFTLSAPETVNISLCPTEQVDRALVLYVRQVCTSPAGEVFNGGHCDGLPEISGLFLQPGTYFIVLAENTGSDTPSGGVYTLRIRSGDRSSLVCQPNLGAAPEIVPDSTFGSCASFYQLNGTAGNFGNPFSGVRAVTGKLDETGLNGLPDDFLSFIPAYSGPVTVTLDCFDQGLNDTDFDIYCATSCPTDGSSPPVIAQSNSLNPVEQLTFNGTGGTTYYLDVQAYMGAGTYHLSVQTP